MVEKCHEFKSFQIPNIKSPTAKNILFQVKKFKTHGSIAELLRTQSTLILSTEGGHIELTIINFFLIFIFVLLLSTK